jgi:hypothetical protein
MKENLLRAMIKKQIKSSLKEADLTGVRGQVGTGLEKVERMASVKMLKKALGQGSPDQQASGLLKVIQAISGDSQIVAKKLARMLMQSGLAAEEPAPEPTEEAVSSSLKARQDRLDKTQAFDMLKKMLATKPATQQTDYVIDLVNKLDLKSGAKTRLLQQMRKGIK